LAVKIIVWQ